MKRKKEKLNNFKHFMIIQTRWIDNDVYHHINNVNYYSYFDTLVNEFLIKKKLLDFKKGNTIGLVVETKCTYFDSITFPDKINAGLRVKRIGNTSVKYQIGLFKNNLKSTAALGEFTHVYVNSKTRAPEKISIKMRKVLSNLL